MRRFRAALFIAGAGILAGGAQADPEQAVLQSGSYEVAYRLEIPHVENWAVNKTRTICVPNAPETGAVALPVLSGNNPLATCPVRNIQREGTVLRFDIACPGRNAARAHAVYTLMPHAFKGRIAMVMGAKNMTMTEVQVGHRIGSCDLANAEQE